MYINKLNIFLNKLINGIGKLRGGFPLDNVVFNYYCWLAQTTNYWRDKQFFFLMQNKYFYQKVERLTTLSALLTSTTMEWVLPFFFFFFKCKNRVCNQISMRNACSVNYGFHLWFFCLWLDYKFNNDALKLDYWLWIII